MLQLREYQRKAVQSVFDYLADHPGKNPCLVIPTGGGKSLCAAAFISACLEWWPDTRILVLTHQKELIEQDAKALHKLVPEISIGIYAAALGCKDLSQPVTFASIQSIYKVSIPEIRFIIVDEAHLINNESRGMYRTLLGRTRARIIGLTATPFRMGQGYITDGDDSIFDDLLQPVSILELQGMGYLAKLRNKGTFTKLDVSDVRLRGGEFIESDLQKELDRFETNEAVTDEIIRTADVYSRHHILIFCSGVEHSEHIASMLSERGMKAGYITGSMGMGEREEILWGFTQGRLQALCNANLLTTGFDYPEIDMICMLRPTMSPGLYLQMAGRGLRFKAGENKDCLVLDFAGNVTRHGPIAFVEPPRRKGEGRSGVAPCKECPQCLEIVPAGIAVCPSCGYVFPKNDFTWVLYGGDVNGDNYERHECWKWAWYITESRKNAIPMIVCELRLNGSPAMIPKFFCVWHERAKQKAIHDLMEIGKKVNAPLKDDWQEYIDGIERMDPPRIIVSQRSKQDKRYRNVVKMLWDEDIEDLRKLDEEKKEAIEDARKRILGYHVS